MSNSGEELPMTSETSGTRLIVPALGCLYAKLHDGAETLLRVVAGGILAIHGSTKIVDPFGAAGMVEGLGFYPGAFWSPLLALHGILRRHPDRARSADPARRLRRHDRAAGHGLVSLGHHGPGLFRGRKVDPVGGDPCVSSSFAAAIAIRSTRGLESSSDPTRSEGRGRQSAALCLWRKNDYETASIKPR